MNDLTYKANENKEPLNTDEESIMVDDGQGNPPVKVDAPLKKAPKAKRKPAKKAAPASNNVADLLADEPDKADNALSAEDVMDTMQRGMDLALDSAAEATTEPTATGDAPADNTDSVTESPAVDLSPEGKKAQALQQNLNDQAKMQTLTNFMFEDEDGEALPPRKKDGVMYVTMLPIAKLTLGTTPEETIRQGDLSIFTLQETIAITGIAEPVHVIPFGPTGQKDASGYDDYSNYIILSGRRRVEAAINLGQSEVPALVDTTIPNELIPFYQVLTQTSKAYTFAEIVDSGLKMLKKQPTLTFSIIEQFFGMHPNDFTKAVQLKEMSVDFPDIYKQVAEGKLTIDAGFKKLEKEIDKRDNPKNADADDEEMSEDDIEDELRNKNKDELADLPLEDTHQDVGDRRILPSNLRRAIEKRDDGECQCCGYGRGEIDVMGVFNVHHIVPVMYQGSDSKDNLILLCQNCHKLVHDYETGIFSPTKDAYERRDDFKRIVILGNMLRTLRKKTFKLLKEKDPNTLNVVQKGKLGLGKGIARSGIDLGGEADFNKEYGSPYEAFVTTNAKLMDKEAAAQAGTLGTLDRVEDDTLPIGAMPATTLNQKPNRNSSNEHSSEKDLAPARDQSDLLAPNGKQYYNPDDTSISIMDKDGNVTIGAYDPDNTFKKAQAAHEQADVEAETADQTAAAAVDETVNKAKNAEQEESFDSDDYAALMGGATYRPDKPIIASDTTKDDYTLTDEELRAREQQRTEDAIRERAQRERKAIGLDPYAENQLAFLVAGGDPAEVPAPITEPAEPEPDSTETTEPAEPDSTEPAETDTDEDSAFAFLNTITPEDSEEPLNTADADSNEDEFSLDDNADEADDSEDAVDIDPADPIKPAPATLAEATPIAPMDTETDAGEDSTDAELSFLDDLTDDKPTNK